MKVIITGGHFSPALSVIEALGDEAEILLVGKKYSFEGEDTLSYEYRVSKEKNIAFESIRAGRFQRKFTVHTIPALLRFPLGIIDSYIIVKKFHPDVVLSFGGYISLPVAVVSFFLGIPVVLHEQIQKAGLSNKIISFFAKKICISFESSKSYFPKDKIVFTGNPLRKEIFSQQKKLEVLNNFKIIYVTGGKEGSHFLNNEISKILDMLLEEYTVIFQTGDSQQFKDFEKLEKLKEKMPVGKKQRLILKKFILPSEIGWVLKNADLIISRSGVNTVLEILALGKSCLLIPLAYSQSQEQLANAILVKRYGLGEYLNQKEITSEKLLEKITYMLENKNLYKKSGETSKYFIPDAGNRIVNVLKSVYEEKNKKKD